MYLSVVFCPLIGSILSGLFGKAFGRMGSVFLSCFFLFITTIFSWIIFFETGINNSPTYIDVFEWISSGPLFFNWSFLFDSLTCIMLLVVSTVSFFVHVYSINYMETDPHVSRFFSYLSLFTFFMLILVTANNFIQLFVGWEGVGVCSYLLINFWYTRIQANKAAMKAMIVNRIGDFGVTLGIIFIYFSMKSVDFSVVFPLVSCFDSHIFSLFGLNCSILTIISILLFIGVIGKSAQIGLHTWLPDAMEGPTPVSALIHAATMVTAGVFLLIRCSPLIEYSSDALFIIALVGAVTAFFAATTGTMQNDLKRVIAYSTCSQLGYMVFACGLSSYSVSAFHLFNHAFFKALLFLGAGSVIHALFDEQDMRKMGGLSEVLPYTYIIMLIGSLALMGIPFLTGFYSKDVILEIAYGTFEIKGLFCYWLGIISAFFTAFYSFRLIYFTFLCKSNSFRSILLLAQDAPFFMSTSLFFLGLGSIFIGFFFKEIFIGMGTAYWDNSIFVLPKNYVLFDSEFLPSVIKLLPFFFSVLGGSVCLFLFSFFSRFLYFFSFSILGKKVYLYLNKKWLFDTLYNEWIASTFLFVGYQITFKLLDRGYIELLGPFGIEKLIYFVGNTARQIHSGYLYHSALIIFIGFVIMTMVSLLLFELAFKYLILYMLFALFILLFS